MVCSGPGPEYTWCHHHSTVRQSSCWTRWVCAARALAAAAAAPLLLCSFQPSKSQPAPWPFGTTSCMPPGHPLTAHTRESCNAACMLHHKIGHVVSPFTLPGSIYIHQHRLSCSDTQPLLWHLCSCKDQTSDRATHIPQSRPLLLSRPRPPLPMGDASSITRCMPTLHHFMGENAVGCMNDDVKNCTPGVTAEMVSRH